MPTEKMEDFIRKIMRQCTVQEIEYCVRNMYRVDAEGCGKVNIIDMVIAIFYIG